jgi:hypothetical protein
MRCVCLPVFCGGPCALGGMRWRAESRSDSLISVRPQGAAASEEYGGTETMPHSRGAAVPPEDAQAGADAPPVEGAAAGSPPTEKQDDDDGEAGKRWRGESRSDNLDSAQSQGAAVQGEHGGAGTVPHSRGAAVPPEDAQAGADAPPVEGAAAGSPPPEQQDDDEEAAAMEAKFRAKKEERRKRQGEAQVWICSSACFKAKPNSHVRDTGCRAGEEESRSNGCKESGGGSC